MDNGEESNSKTAILKKKRKREIEPEAVRHGDYPRSRNFPAPFLVKLDCGNWINEAVSRTPARLIISNDK